MKRLLTLFLLVMGWEGANSGTLKFETLELIAPPVYVTNAPPIGTASGSATINNLTADISASMHVSATTNQASGFFTHETGNFRWKYSFTPAYPNEPPPSVSLAFSRKGHTYAESDMFFQSGTPSGSVTTDSVLDIMQAHATASASTGVGGVYSKSDGSQSDSNLAPLTISGQNSWVYDSVSGKWFAYFGYSGAAVLDVVYYALPSFTYTGSTSSAHISVTPLSITAD